jgi:hypothetical protein
MRRRLFTQPDLFGEAVKPAPTAEPPPLDQLSDMLAMLRAAEYLPWPDAAATMAEERRALGLARLAEPEGEALAAAILVETERLLAATD